MDSFYLLLTVFVNIKKLNIDKETGTARQIRCVCVMTFI